MSESQVTPFDDWISDDGRTEPWGPQPGETAVGFQAFVVYRSLAPGRRSAAAVARELGRDVTVIRALSAKFNWADRAFSFDAAMDKRAVEELARGRTQMRAEHADMAVMARNKITKRLKELNPDEMSVRDLLAFMEVAVKLERQARGEPDKTVAVSGEINIVESLPADQRRSLMAEALKALSDRLGVHDRPAEIEAYEDADVIEDEDDREEAQGREREDSAVEAERV